MSGSFPDIFELEKTNLVYDKNTRIVYYGYVKGVKNMSDGEELYKVQELNNKLKNEL